jgi:hypothetical protein
MMRNAEMRTRRRLRLIPGLVLAALAAGCGTQRTATEQLLVSNAVDQAVSQLDFRPLAGKMVYFDPQYLDGTVDRGYLISSLRQHLLACGCILQEDRTKATYVVEARSGGVGTDRNSLLVGIPQMTIPTFVPGQPSNIPEIPFAKKTDQKGIAKIAVFAYNRETGRPVFQSGTLQAVSTAKDTWLLGAGPFQRGTIRDGTEFAGVPLHFLLIGEREGNENPPPTVPVTQAVSWTEPPPAKAGPNLPGASAPGVRLTAGGATDSTKGGQAGAASAVTMPPAPLVGGAGSPPPADSAKAPTTSPPPPPNLGGQAETEPAAVQKSGVGSDHGG